MIALMLAAMLAQAAPEATATDTAPSPPQVTDAAPAPAPAPPASKPPRLMGPGPDADDPLGQRIAASYQAVEALQGPLDGSWTLVGADDAPIFAFQLVDRPGGEGPLEGMWRDLRHAAVAGDINPIDSLQRAGPTLTVSLAVKPGADPDAIALTLGPDGVWSGQLTEAGKITPVRLRRS